MQSGSYLGEDDVIQIEDVFGQSDPRGAARRAGAPAAPSPPPLLGRASLRLRRGIRVGGFEFVVAVLHGQVPLLRLQLTCLARGRSGAVGRPGA